MRQARESVELQDFKALYEFLKAKPICDLSRDRCLPYKVMNIENEGSLWGTKSFISKFVAKFFVEKAQHASLHEHSNFAQMKNPFAMQAFGHMFEEWAYAQLVQGNHCTLDKFEMKGSFKKAGTFERSDVKNQTSMQAKLEDGALLKAPVNYGSIDMFGMVQCEDGNSCQLLMFQETVGKQHRSAQWSDVGNIVGACEKRSKEVKKVFECLLCLFHLPRMSEIEGRESLRLKGAAEC